MLGTGGRGRPLQLLPQPAQPPDADDGEHGSGDLLPAGFVFFQPPGQRHDDERAGGGDGEDDGAAAGFHDRPLVTTDSNDGAEEHGSDQPKRRHAAGFGFLQSGTRGCGKALHGQAHGEINESSAEHTGGAPLPRLADSRRIHAEGVGFVDCHMAQRGAHAHADGAHEGKQHASRK